MNLTDVAENLLIDFLFRRQPLGLGGSSSLGPSSLFVGLLASVPGDAGAAAEVVGGGYARAQIACSLEAWSGTQGPGSTTASAGASGMTSNNAPVTFPAPTANWGTVVAYAVFDAATGGTRIFSAPLTAPRTIVAGDDGPQFQAAGLTFTLG